MSTWTAITRLPGESAAEALGEALEALRPAPAGVGVFEIEDGSGLWEVGAYFTDPPDQAGLALLSALHGAADFAVSRLDDRDWVAQVQRELHPVVAGRIFLHGPHDAHRVPVNAIPLRIEAAMAFGTGHHGTTLGCLRAMVRLGRLGLRPRRVADIGCGTGVLAIAAAKLWRARCVAVDIDAVAVRTARANMAVNGVQGLVRTGAAAGFRAPLLRAAMPFDLVLANILAGPLRRLAPQTRAALAPGGIAVLSGILDRQLPAVLAVHAGHGMRRIGLERIGGWSTVTLRRD
ncbi:MAG: ribosomal protein L11 methyltransferase [Paracoccaceae bacterium]|nr:MAG: 50S ribosomal protein L11 methyltransferase [Alphaproteobacteria bacterium]GIX13995.1 MAG: ribosomal protein L11 methyltransferase [Paracoccaceae bacterium]